MDEIIMEKIDSLAKTRFRGSFHLNSKMKEYVREKGLAKIEQDTYDFINNRLAPANPKNDGKQTPMRQVHPTFIAMHANGFCCRNCLNRIHHIEKNKTLSSKEIDYIVKFIMIWIRKEINSL